MTPIAPLITEFLLLAGLYAAPRSATGAWRPPGSFAMSSSARLASSASSSDSSVTSSRSMTRFSCTVPAKRKSSA